MRYPRRYCFFAIAAVMNSTPLLADSWSEGNYPPDDKSIVIGETNLPIVFIDIRNGSTDTNPDTGYRRYRPRHRSLQ